MKTIKLTVGILEICALYYATSFFGIMHVSVVLNETVNVQVASLYALAMVSLGMAIQMIATRRNRGDGANIFLLVVSAIAAAFSIVGIVQGDKVDNLNYLFVFCNAANGLIALFDIMEKWQRKKDDGQEAS